MDVCLNRPQNPSESIVDSHKLKIFIAIQYLDSRESHNLIAFKSSIHINEQI